jgi:hypothetical protein
MVEYITKRGMPNMGYTVKLDHEFKDEDGDKVDRVHYPHNYVDAA